MKLEIACFNLESALIAQRSGANRIELCDDFSVGGITPNYGTFETARKLITIELFVMIRPRGGDFSYSEDEFEQMKKDLIYFKSKGADGFVFGILNSDGSINKKQNSVLVELAKPLPCTFHRAFDIVNNLSEALEDVIACGFKTILTSGQKANAIEGIPQLTQLLNEARGRIVIMPGGGVRSFNIDLLKKNIATSYYHSSGIVSGEIADAKEIKSLREKLK